MRRSYEHPDLNVDVVPVLQGVNLTFVPLDTEVAPMTAELGQDGAIGVAAALMWRAGCRCIRISQSKDKAGALNISLDFKYPHPFDAIFNATDPNEEVDG